ncbi:SMI1/KNR4 family protein [Mucilaginibacter sp. RCC_168]|uniref:SMI1/KNR4 family protein n=1 Tax=Mucilaginibacter sp. RCC_168 TaxID=3239221 RepID=UPI00352625A8
MNNRVVKKLESVGGIERNLFCSYGRQQREDSFLNIETIFNSPLPQSYKDFYIKVGAFSFLELVCAKCIDANRVMVKGNKVNVGDFYCIIGNGKSSTDKALSTFQEQLPAGLLPICDGELGDIICISLRKADYEYIYYLHHESPPGNDLFLVAKSFEDLIMSLEIYKEASGDDDLVKKMKMELSPQMIDLLKKSGYGPKE